MMTSGSLCVLINGYTCACVARKTLSTITLHVASYTILLTTYTYAFCDAHIGTKSLVLSKKEFDSFNDVGKAFIALQTKMKIIFKKADYSDLRRACIVQMHNPGGAKLSAKLVEQISARQNIDDLFDLLVCCPYWSWIDIRMLEAMVIASDNPQAAELLHNYKDVVFSKKIIELLQSVFSKEVEEDYTKMVTKIKKDPKEMTVGDLLELQSKLEVEIMDIKKGISVLEHWEKGCIEIHWYIPSCCVDGVYQNAIVRCYQFNDLHLLHLKIGHYPVIHDPLASPDVVVSAPSPPVNVGKLCNIILLACVLLFCLLATVKDFIKCYYDYLSVNMDAEVVTQLMVSQQLLNEDTVVAASSDYQKIFLILQQVRMMNVETLVSFSELLLTSDSQKHIGTVLIDGM